MQAIANDLGIRAPPPSASGCTGGIVALAFVGFLVAIAAAITFHEVGVPYYWP